MRFFIPLLPAPMGVWCIVCCAFLQAASSPRLWQGVHVNYFPPDTVPENEIRQNSLRTDSLAADSAVIRVPFSKDTIDAEVAYSARDSIVYDVKGKKVHLYGEATAKYKNIELKSDYIVYDWSASTLTALMKEDSAGKSGYADFTDGSGDYKAKKLSYNFKTKKGKVFQVMTQEGEGYIHSEAVKRQPNNEWYGYKGKYTTCNLEHPHFYFRAKKIKVVPDKVIAAGPTNMVIADVPLPAYIPFALFPIRKGQRSGILLPEYGEERTRGFFLRNGGYYFAISDYFDLQLRGDVYTNGSFAVKTNSYYRKRYKFNGNLSINYGQNRAGEPESPDFNVSNDFRVYWNHSQDARTALQSRFSARVDFGTSSYDRLNSQDRERILNNSLNSTVSYAKSWAGTPFSLSINFSGNQQLNAGIITLQLPVLTFGVSRIQPFQPRKGVFRQRWYHSIGFSYAFEGQNIISGTDSAFLKKETFRDARYGIRHTVPVSGSIKLFKYFTLVPRFSYTERWYYQYIRKTWSAVQTSDTAYYAVVTDTLLGFKAARDFNMGASLTTKLFGQLNFKGKVKAIRHVFTPSLHFNYVPDFSLAHWGYYKKVQTDIAGTVARYSIFDGVGIYGSPPGGLVGSVGLSLSNVLEMKVFSKKDTVRHEKKIGLLESFIISGNYNLAADSLNFSPVTITGRTSFAESKVRINFDFTLDPYATDSANRRINKFVFEEQRHFTRLTRANFSLTSRFQSKKAGTPALRHEQYVSEEERQMIERNRELYYDFNIPWSFSLSYNIGLTKGIPGNPGKLQISTNSVEFHLDANLTPRWKLVLDTGYDFNDMDFVLTYFRVIRDLHCWELSFDWTPYPVNAQRYAIQLNVKASILQDMKLTRKKDRFDSVF